MKEKEALQAHADDLQIRYSRHFLTGALNRAFFDEKLRILYYRGVDHGNRHRLTFVDLNDFKRLRLLISVGLPLPR